MVLLCLPLGGPCALLQLIHEWWAGEHAIIKPWSERRHTSYRNGVRCRHHTSSASNNTAVELE
eukprot:1789474-Amphidinium_carterae.1